MSHDLNQKSDGHTFPPSDCRKGFDPIQSQWANGVGSSPCHSMKRGSTRPLANAGILGGYALKNSEVSENGLRAKCTSEKPGDRWND